MIRSMKVALVSLGLVLGTAGCNTFLTGEKLSNNPNSPTQASRQQLFVAVQAGQFGQQESTVPLTVCMWMQQCTGVGGRFVEQYGEYNVTEFSFNFDFNSVFTGGGLLDIRQIEQSAQADGDSVFLGIAKVWEAFVMGTAADYWGNIPYNEAAGTSTTPALDPQLQVYDSVQSKLSQAIAELTGPGAGPGAADLVYGGAATLWIAAAHTLKARFYLHTAEASASPATVYAKVITEASQGISSSANDFRTFHTSATSERNIWYQFALTTFGQDVVAGKFLVDTMVARNDPRLPEYFGKNKLGGYGGDDVNTAQPANTVSPLTGTRNSPTFPQPLVTWYENQLILAEARFQTGDTATARTLLNAVRARVYGAPNPTPAANGTPLFQAIMMEKYIALFQNEESWNDYRRTCIPKIKPFPTVEFNNRVPGRLFYGSSERNVNTNIPTPSDQLAANGFRNPNDPSPCP